MCEQDQLKFLREYYNHHSDYGVSLINTRNNYLRFFLTLNVAIVGAMILVYNSFENGVAVTVLITVMAVGGFVLNTIWLWFAESLNRSSAISYRTLAALELLILPEHRPYSVHLINNTRNYRREIADFELNSDGVIPEVERVFTDESDNHWLFKRMFVRLSNAVTATTPSAISLAFPSFFGLAFLFIVPMAIAFGTYHPGTTDVQEPRTFACIVVNQPDLSDYAKGLLGVGRMLKSVPEQIVVCQR